MSRKSDAAVDELASAVSAGMILSSLPEATKAATKTAPAAKPNNRSNNNKKKAEAKAPAEGAATTAEKGGTVAVHDRWTLVEESKIDYGYLAKTGGAIPPAVVDNKSFYVTTAINYTNGPAHMGHAYEGTTTDVIARFGRLCGDQSVYFVTGSDEHGQKIATTAQEANTEPIDLCNKVSANSNIFVCLFVCFISIMYSEYYYTRHESNLN